MFPVHCVLEMSLSLLGMHFGRSPISQRLVRPLMVVVDEVAIESMPGITDRLVRVDVDLLHFTDRHRRSTNALSRARPRPSVLIAPRADPADW